jgi:hypothetical protein
VDIRFGTWNVRGLIRTGLLLSVAKEISEYKFDLMRVQVMWDRGGTKPTGNYAFFYEEKNENYELSKFFFLYIR